MSPDFHFRVEVLWMEPEPCPDARDWRDVTEKHLCEKTFLVGDVEHGCASRRQHHLQRLHVCVCGARRIEP